MSSAQQINTTVTQQAVKYITLDEGIDFRRIAEIMSAAGWRMNHATARNVLMSSLAKLVRNISEELGTAMSEEQITRTLRVQLIHDALSDVLHAAYCQIKQEKKNP